MDTSYLWVCHRIINTWLIVTNEVSNVNNELYPCWHLDSLRWASWNNYRLTLSCRSIYPMSSLKVFYGRLQNPTAGWPAVPSGSGRLSLLRTIETGRNRTEPPVNRRLGFEAVPYHKLDYYNDVHISLEILNIFQPNLAEIWLMHYSVITR